MFYKQVILGLY